MTKRIIPEHLAIIPDGNRRWARKRGMKGFQGISRKGSYEHLKSLFKEAESLGVKYVSLWGFSTENWKRPKKEIDVVFDTILKSLKRFREDAKEDKLKFRHLGRKDRIPKDVLSSMEQLEDETKNFTGLNVQLCLDYGGRDEILRAVNEAARKGQKVDEKTFSDYLDTKGIPDVEMVIRTSGEKRTSGMMPFQSAYAELYFSRKYFPDFKKSDLRKAIEDFGRRKRNYGK